MEIKELSWSRFYMPIQPKDGESEEQFLERARDCLSAFYKKYTAVPENEQDKESPFKLAKEQLGSLKAEFTRWDFGYLNLKGFDVSQGACKVEFFVGTPKDNYGHVGIEVLCGAAQEYLKPKMEILKSKWKDFQYAT
jgi:hypothetical protein